VNNHTPITSDGPDAVLYRLSTRLRLPHSRSDIARFVATHPRPSSLLALIDIARQLGVELKPGKTDLSALDSLDVPFVAHFNGTGGGGFALVEGRSENGLQLWDSTNGARVVDEETFASQWSGVVAMIDSAPEPAGRLGQVKQKVTETIAGGLEPPSIAGGLGAWALRILLGAVALSLMALAVADQPDALRVPVAAIAALAIAGLVVAALMSIAIASYGGPYSPGICGRGRLVDCQSVLTSRFAKLAGFSLSDVGASFYAAVMLLIAVSAVVQSRAVVSVVGLAFIGSVGAAVVLIGVQLAMRKLCTLCLAAHAINLAGAVVAWRYLLPDGPRVANLGPAALLLALAFLLVLFFVTPYLKDHSVLKKLSGDYQRMTSSPFGSLAQMMTERPTGLVGAEVGVALNDSDGRDELVAFLHPGCSQCEPVLREIHGLGSKAQLRVFVSLPPKDDRERALCEAITAAGISLGSEGFVQTFGVAKKRFAELVRKNPNAELGVDPAAIESVVPRARELVARSEAFANEHVEGTPALFFNSLPFQGTVAHLVTLVGNYQDLLPRPAPHE
jgi:uncharacterized membrane protein